MKKNNYYLLQILYFFISILVLSLFITVLNYFDILNGNLFKIIKFLIPIISSFIFSIKIGKKASKKGLIEGLKFGLILDILLLFINIIFIRKINIYTTILYLLIILLSTFGGILGKNKKK